MKQFLNILIVLFLILNAASAMYGGIQFMLHPDGSSLNVPLEWLQESPFNNYFIPGLLLFISNGICSLLVLAAVLFKHKSSPWFVMGQGVILAGWILGQLVLIQHVETFHLVMGGGG